MDTSTVVPLTAARERSRRVDRAMAARRRLHAARAERRTRARGGGRVWVNGGELGGTPLAVAHLTECYD